MTPDELDRIYRAADAAQRTASDWARLRLLAAAENEDVERKRRR